MNDERPTISRREFAALTLAAGVSAAARGAPDGGSDMLDSDVLVKTPAGTCDAALVHPRAGGIVPAVIIFPDIFGLRPTMRTMAKRLAANGYAVLVPNPFYRSTKAPGLTLDFDFGSAADRAKLDAFRAPLTSDAVMQDAAAYVAFLDAHPSVDKKAPIGVVGYCMGGPMTMQAAAACPQRIGAGASFHGGGLVTDKPDSPHLLAPRIKARFYFGIAASDDEKQPDAKNRLRDAFSAAGTPAQIEVYAGTLHGWCVPDMPLQAGKPIYDEPQAERAWSELTALYKGARV
jgi:carboxymethylenebutenolidase